MPFEGTADVDPWLYIADFSTRSGETVFGLPETEGPELPLKRSFLPAETANRLCAPQNRGYSLNHGKSRLAPGRTRTSNQPVMDSMSLSLVTSIFCHRCA